MLSVHPDLKMVRGGPAPRGRGRGLLFRVGGRGNEKGGKGIGKGAGVGQDGGGGKGAGRQDGGKGKGGGGRGDGKGQGKGGRWRTGPLVPFQLDPRGTPLEQLGGSVICWTHALSVVVYLHYLTGLLT